MGAVHLVVPLDATAREALTDYASEADIAALSDGRHPYSQADVLKALQSLPIFVVEPAAPPEPPTVWRLTLTHRDHPERSAALEVPADGSNLVFEAGDVSVMQAVLSELCHSCGTLLLWPDTGDDPIIVQPPKIPAAMPAKERLEARLTANRKRLNTASFIAGLSEPLRRVIAAAAIVDDAVSEKLNIYSEPTQHGFVSNWGDVAGRHTWRTKTLPDHYAFTELQTAQEVVAFIAQESNLAGDADVYLHFGVGDVLSVFRLRFGDIEPFIAAFLEPMKFGETRQLYGSILQAQTSGFSMIRTDFSAGITVDDLRASLPECYTHNFEVACWRNEEAVS